jgi:hypothetical protein
METRGKIAYEQRLNQWRAKSPEEKASWTPESEVEKVEKGEKGGRINPRNGWRPIDYVRILFNKIDPI